ncbi:MAG: hypothetical protein MJB12_18135 [Firmicutes bacterium]|nr:hypothetical protein [Bacillota bacterium]
MENNKKLELRCKLHYRRIGGSPAPKYPEISQKDQYKNIVNKILDMLTQEKDTLILQRENEIPDMNTFDLTKDKLSLKWFTVDQNQFFKMMSVEFQERLILDLIISNKSTLSQ